MSKKESTSMDFGVRLKGSLAAAFEKERRQEGAAKAEMVRILLMEALRARGHEDIEDPIEWGGYRERREEEPGQRAAVAAL